MIRRILVLSTCLLTLLAVTACGDEEGAGDSRPSETFTSRDGEKFNDADVSFATDMIQHHAQALAMVDLTTGRTLDPEVASLAEQILMAQGPEIEQMVTWLTDWERPVPETVRDHANAHGDGHGDSHEDMPGMMSGDEMAALEAAPDADFQQLWLEMMIEHHEGAITMAEDQQEDGVHEPAVELATQIAEAQQQEIDTMRDLLDS